MPLLTTSVPSSANSGMISSTATKALRIKSYCHQPNSVSNICRPLLFRKGRTGMPCWQTPSPDRRTPPPRGPAAPPVRMPPNIIEIMRHQQNHHIIGGFEPVHRLIKLRQPRLIDADTGSSRINRSGFGSVATASSTRCSSPPDSRPTGLSSSISAEKRFRCASSASACFFPPRQKCRIGRRIRQQHIVHRRG